MLNYSVAELRYTKTPCVYERGLYIFNNHAYFSLQPTRRQVADAAQQFVSILLGMRKYAS